MLKRLLNETGTSVEIPKAGKVATRDPRAKELGGSPVLKLLGDEWAAGKEPPGVVVPLGDTAGLRKAVKAEVVATRAELRVNDELTSTRAEVTATRAELKTSSE